MRKGKRFTPALLEKWQREGRGRGLQQQYQPWHQVTRSDPGSRGRSHLINWRFGRLHHLLSDQELVAFCFAVMHPDLHDIREQYALPLYEDVAELSIVDGAQRGLVDGTLSLATSLGIKHPAVRKDGVARPWVMSTDLLLTLQRGSGVFELVAVSVKDSQELSNARKLDLLRIERAYWEHQGILWLLLTPDQFTKAVAINLRYSMPWAVDPKPYSAECLEQAREIYFRHPGATSAEIVSAVARHFSYVAQDAQRALWQAVWSGRITLDLGSALRPSSLLRTISPEAFWSQNPIVSRRSAWQF
jgi:hypothetical protein